jgi:peptidyl-tRNA hydrolase
LKADEKEWIKLKQEIKDQPHVIVRDAGLTELEPGTETVIGLWPVRKSKRSKTVARLQVLK